MEPEQGRKPCDGVPPVVSYGDQDENGIDLSLLRANLRLTPTERLMRLEQAAASLTELKRNAVKRNVRLSRNA